MIHIFVHFRDKTEMVQIGDGSALKDIKDNISQSYGVVIDVVEPTEDEATLYRDVYDDEYDDTYDTNVVGADDDDDADELTNRRLENYLYSVRSE